MTRPSRILLVDDEPPIQRAVAPLLRSRGFEVEVVGTGTSALQALERAGVDLVVLDLGLPDLEGTEVCRRIRARSPMPIIVLSARGAEADKVSALEIGADDYVTKPFGPDELVARIKVALRRASAPAVPPAEGRLVSGDFAVDYDRHRVTLRGQELRLTPKEFDLMSLLARNADRVLTHRAILKAIWNAGATDQPERLWVLIGQVRKKIEDNPAEPRYLLSEPWVGYRLVTSPDSSAS
jgi:two-component system KDP operon response regulator KdpE